MHLNVFSETFLYISKTCIQLKIKIVEEKTEKNVTRMKNDFEQIKNLLIQHNITLERDFEKRPEIASDFYFWKHYYWCISYVKDVTQFHNKLLMQLSQLEVQVNEKLAQNDEIQTTKFKHLIDNEAKQDVERNETMLEKLNEKMESLKIDSVNNEKELKSKVKEHLVSILEIVKAYRVAIVTVGAVKDAILQTVKENEANNCSIDQTRIECEQLLKGLIQEIIKNYSVSQK